MTHPTGRTARWTFGLKTDAFADRQADIADFLAAERVTGRAAFVSQLVVEEVVRNLIEHTPRDACVEEVSVAIAIADDHVDVVIDDRRPSFDPGDAPPLDTGAPLDERSAGGMGLHLVREMTDVLDYERTDDGNRLTARIGR